MKLELFYPVKPKMINQYFGNKDPRYLELGLPGHNGIDFFASHGQPVYASHEGYAFYQIDDHGGHGVLIISTQKYDYKDAQAQFKSIYWHLCDSLKEPQYKSMVEGYPNGIYVTAGTCIGYADNTGFSTGDHLHFGLKPFSGAVNIEQDNGYSGAIDPMPYFNGLYAEDIGKTIEKYVFSKNLKYGDIGPDVEKLQRILIEQKFLDIPYPTGAYWVRTAHAVLDWQLYNKVADTAELYSLGGKVFGPKSRAFINQNQ